ncbi:Ig-like domain-containing protein [Paenibacillus rigui]|uniref:Ig-like domain-containing protein n=1 Tax=Paenibacillus rigui TaxID=554312 RepID=UPI001FE2AD5F|nr:Ig-like domain-containing protein [Paenibacillus rigui]
MANPSGQYAGTWYIDGNIMEGSPSVTADNWSGVSPDFGFGSLTKLTKPAVIPDFNDPIGGPVSTDSAINAYNKVLAGSGATLPKLDQLDARIINDVKKGTGKIVNTIASDGGLPVLNSLPAPADSDHDGMPDAWENAHGLNPGDASDRNGDYNNDGYTNLEKYLNTLTTTGSANPDVSVTAPKMYQQFTAGSDVTINATASDKDGTIAKVEFYDGSTKIGESLAAPYSFTWKGAPLGQHYMYAKAIDDTGTMTLSSVVIIYVKGPENVAAPWTSKDIGTVAIPGTANLTGTTFTVKGSGNLSAASDSFHYVYQPVQGDFEMVSNVAFDSEVDNGVKFGLMARETLEPGSKATMLVMSEEEYEGKYATMLNRATKSANYSNLGEVTTEQDHFAPPYYLKLIRKGNVISGYAGSDLTHWRLVASATVDMADQIYLGMAVDAHKGTNNNDYLTSATFKEVTVKRGAAFSITNASTDTTNIPQYTIQGTMVDHATISITRDGLNLVDPFTVAAGQSFSKPIQLNDGLNKIVVSALNTESFGDFVNSKQIAVTYNKVGTIVTPNQSVPSTVNDPKYTYSGSVNKNAKVTITLNGTTIVNAETKQANESFSVPLTLTEGTNKLVVSAIDDFAIAGVYTYTITYSKEWGAGVFTASAISIKDLQGNTLSRMAASKDIYVSVTFHNNSLVDKSGIMVIALFDADNKMATYTFADQTVAAGSDKSFMAIMKMPENLTGWKVKAFAWNSLANKSVISNEAVLQ